MELAHKQRAHEAVVAASSTCLLLCGRDPAKEFADTTEPGQIESDGTSVRNELRGSSQHMAKTVFSEPGGGRPVNLTRDTMPCSIVKYTRSHDDAISDATATAGPIQNRADCMT